MNECNGCSVLSHLLEKYVQFNPFHNGKKESKKHLLDCVKIALELSSLT